MYFVYVLYAGVARKLIMYFPPLIRLLIVYAPWAWLQYLWWSCHISFNWVPATWLLLRALQWKRNLGSYELPVSGSQPAQGFGYSMDTLKHYMTVSQLLFNSPPGMLSNKDYMAAHRDHTEPSRHACRAFWDTSQEGCHGNLRLHGRCLDHCYFSTICCQKLILRTILELSSKDY